MKKLAIACLVGILGMAAAHANVIPSFVSATPGSTTTLWTYNINVTVDQEVHTGDFFTIYDFGSIVPFSNVQPAGWVFSTNLVGVTPPQTLPPDNPAIPNLTWTYTGSTALSGGPIGPFSVEIPGIQTQTRSSFFAAQGTKIDDPLNTKIGNVGAIVVPVPEPSTIALIIGTGGLGLVGRAISRRNKI
jgi:hypothetical protein